jgi:hypothetical protein
MHRTCAPPSSQPGLTTVCMQGVRLGELHPDYTKVQPTNQLLQLLQAECLRQQLNYTISCHTRPHYTEATLCSPHTLLLLLLLPGERCEVHHCRALIAGHRHPPTVKHGTTVLPQLPAADTQHSTSCGRGSSQDRASCSLTLTVDVWCALPVFLPSCHRRSKTPVFQVGTER